MSSLTGAAARAGVEDGASDDLNSCSFWGKLSSSHPSAQQSGSQGVASGSQMKGGERPLVPLILIFGEAALPFPLPVPLPPCVKCGL
jgi:hypothetical protein